MISYKNLEIQLKRINFHYTGWGNSEVRELCNILSPDEEIEELVNGYYEAGFALLVATKTRLLLVDKKPLNYLSVEDMRFDMINQLDYNHRLFGAQIRVSAGNKVLHFTSMNQVRLRRLLAFVQNRMTVTKQEQKHSQDMQQAHLEAVSKQLQLYLMMQQHQFMTQQPGSPQPETAPNPFSSFLNQPTAAAMPSVPTPSQSLSVQQLGISAMKRVIPVISAYTRLPFHNRERAIARQQQNRNWQPNLN
jgi:hypothetical protein